MLLIEKVLLLKSQDFFGETPEDVLADLAASMTELEFTDGDRLWDTATIDPRLFLVAEGQVRLEADEKPAATLASGDMYGDLALIANARHAAAGRAATDGLLLAANREAFDRLVTEHEQTAVQIMTILARRLLRQPAAAQHTRLDTDVLGTLQERLSRTNRRATASQQRDG